MTRPVILLDVDGVLADFTGATLDFLRTLGVDRRAEYVTEFAIEDALGLSSAQRARMKARWAESGFCASIPVYDGAVAGVERLRGIGAAWAASHQTTAGAAGIEAM